MKYAYYGFGMLLFGSIGLVIIVMMQSITINNDAEYYDLKEAMKAAMLESIDYECYRTDARSDGCGYTLKISEQKFVENFTKRFVTTIGGDAKNYSLEFYDIIESPPKASVVIKGMTNSYGIVSQNESLTITNSLSGILELNTMINKSSSRLTNSEENLDNNDDFEIMPDDNDDDFETSTDATVDNYNLDEFPVEDNICSRDKDSVDRGCVSQNNSSIDDDNVVETDNNVGNEVVE